MKVMVVDDEADVRLLFEQRAVDYGCDDYFTKPLDFGMLQEKLLA